jgi:cobalt-zinc-cadmium efflux system outer membrane protein
VLKNYIFLFTFTTSLFSVNIKEIKKQVINNNQELQSIQNDIKISSQDEFLSTKWKNIILGFGVNDILINDLTKRDKEAMQTQYITLSQNIPMGNKLEYKKDIQKTQSNIYNLLLKDKEIKFNSLIVLYLNEYKIVEKKINYINKMQENLQRIKNLQIQKFKLSNLGQIEILNTDTKLLKLNIQKQNLYNNLEVIKINLQKVSYTNIENIEYELPKYQPNSNLNILKLLKNNNMYLALEQTIHKNKQNIDFQKAMKTSDLKVNIGYYQREKFDDYISFGLAYPLSIYGTENIKVKKANIQYTKQKIVLKQFENEFVIKIKLLLQNMHNAYKNYQHYKFSIIDKQKQIAGLLNAKSISNNINTIKQFTNENLILSNELKALDELAIVYDSQAKLLYFKGESL